MDEFERQKREMLGDNYPIVNALIEGADPQMVFGGGGISQRRIAQAPMK